jgi:hypothetical protein
MQTLLRTKLDDRVFVVFPTTKSIALSREVYSLKLIGIVGEINSILGINIKADPESGQADGSFIPPIKCLLSAKRKGSIDTANQLGCLFAQNHALFGISDVWTPAYEANRVRFAYRVI